MKTNIKSIALILICGRSPLFETPAVIEFDDTSVSVMPDDETLYVYPLHTVKRVKVVKFTEDEIEKFREDEAVNKLLDLEELDELEDETES